MANRIGGKGEKLAKAALSVTRSKVTITGDYEDDRQKFGAMTQDLAITFDGNNNVLANGIKDDVQELQDYFNTTYTGDITVVTSVDFTGETTTTSTISVVDGIITEVN